MQLHKSREGRERHLAVLGLRGLVSLSDYQNGHSHSSTIMHSLLYECKVLLLE